MPSLTTEHSDTTIHPLPAPATSVQEADCTVKVRQLAEALGRTKPSIRKWAARLDPEGAWRVTKADKTEYYHPKLAAAVTEVIRQSPRGLEPMAQQSPVIDGGSPLTSMAEGYEAEIPRLKAALERAEAERDLAYAERTKAYAERDKAFQDRTDAMGQVAAAREKAAALQAALQAARERELRGFHLPGTRRRIEATYIGLLPAPDASHK